MPSLNYNSVLRDEALGQVIYGADTFYAMLVTSAYVVNKDTHTKRSDITSEVVGVGYAAGGIPVAATVGAIDTANDRLPITFAAHNWPTATITARGEVIYKRRGGAATADELICFNEFDTDKTSTAGTFAVSATVITKQN